MLRAGHRYRVEFNASRHSSSVLSPHLNFEFCLGDSMKTQDGGFDLTLIIDANSFAFYTANAPPFAIPIQQILPRIPQSSKDRQEARDLLTLGKYFGQEAEGLGPHLAALPGLLSILATHQGDIVEMILKGSTASDTCADEVPQPPITSGDIQQAGTKRESEDKIEEPSVLRQRRL